MKGKYKRARTRRIIAAAAFYELLHIETEVSMPLDELQRIAGRYRVNAMDLFHHVTGAKDWLRR